MRVGLGGWFHPVVIGSAALLLGGFTGSSARSHGSPDTLQVPEGTLVAFPRPDLGYFVTPEGAVRRSHDGGRSWQRVGSVAPLIAVDFVSPTDGFGLTTRGILVATNDGGRTWRAGRRFVSAPTEIGPGQPPMVVDFVDADHGFVASGPTHLFRTRDAGHSWQRLGFRCPRSNYLGGLAFASRREGFAACGGQAATAMQWRTYHFTADGGTTWRSGRSHVASGHVALVSSPSERVRYVYASRLGISRLGGPVLLFTDDVDSVLAMTWPTPRVAYALLRQGGLRRTIDGGRTWRVP